MFLSCHLLAAVFIVIGWHSQCARAASLRLRTEKEAEKGVEPDGEKLQSREKRMTVDLMGFLMQYGYMPTLEEDDSTFYSEATFTEAIREFQRFNGLPVTGQPDELTIQKMLSPRCGYPDIPSSDGAKNVMSPTSPQSFTTLGTRWQKDTVTWKPVQLSKKLSEADQWKAIESGLKHWSEVAPLNFQHSPGSADIEMTFARYEHGDGATNRFDGEGRVLAHAFQPGAGMGGDVHFDEDEAWTVGTGSGTDLETVAAHEFGHALGLGHSENPGALMAPYYKYTPSLRLHSDDVRAIQTLYGSRSQTSTPSPATSPSTTTTSTSTTTTTTAKQPATSTPYSPDKPFCGPDFHLDAITGGPEQMKYIFHHNLVYRLGLWGLESDFPRPVDQVFKDGPTGNLLAAVYIPETSQHYLFQSTQYWRFTNFLLDNGFPRSFNIQYTPSAALTFHFGYGDTRIFMFGNATFWEWDPVTEKVVSGYPLPTDVYWQGAPRSPDAAFNTDDGYTFFFKANKYYKLRNRVSIGEPRLLGPDWFGPSCRASSSLNKPGGLLKDKELSVNGGDKQHHDLSPVLPLPKRTFHFPKMHNFKDKHH